MKRHGISRTLRATAAFLLVIIGAAAASGDDMEGMITPYADGKPTYIAVPFDLAVGERVEALRWYNNDGSTALLEVLLVGTRGGKPDLAADAYSQTDVYGSSDAWTQLDIPSPVTGTGGTVFAVFKIPAVSRTTTGVGGGPGIGYRGTDAGSALLSADGVEWVGLPASIGLAVETVTTGGALAKSTTGGSSLAEDPSSQAAPLRTGLASAYPNPANPSIRVKFTMAEAGDVDVSVYNVRGQLVRRLVDRWVPAGEHQAQWLGTDDRGGSVSSGVYYVRFRAHGVAEHTRVTVVR